ncbi:hypothetical protein [Nocardia pseudovaccinii]|uniref:hypothetical protein n=1 Tax=Nocardia pseudovaccinii TaxID=189540 RepID=UPI0007A37711|nr:hypothetical protein [Nocardia pseudovaccinii]
MRLPDSGFEKLGKGAVGQGWSNDIDTLATALYVWSECADADAESEHSGQDVLLQDAQCAAATFAGHIGEHVFDHGGVDEADFTASVFGGHGVAHHRFVVVDRLVEPSALAQIVLVGGPRWREGGAPVRSEGDRGIDPLLCGVQEFAARTFAGPVWRGPGLSETDTAGLPVSARLPLIGDGPAAKYTFEKYNSRIAVSAPSVKDT